MTAQIWPPAAQTFGQADDISVISITRKAVLQPAGA